MFWRRHLSLSTLSDRRYTIKLVERVTSLGSLNEKWKAHPRGRLTEKGRPEAVFVSKMREVVYF